MRIKALPVILCMASALSIQAQDPLPVFGEPTRIWTSERNGSYNGFCLETWRSTNWIGGDTVISGTSYRVLRARERHYVTPIIDPCNEMQEYALPNIYVREADGEVYALNPSLTAEYLIYDFNASVGDSIPFPSSVWDMSGWATVLDEDSVLIDGGYRKRWNVNSVWNGLDTVWIIEGIGSTTGLFNPLVYVDFETAFLLNCVHEHGEVIFDQDGCELITSIAHLERPMVAAPFPDPTTGDITLDDRVTRARIVAMDGRTVFDGTYHEQVLHLDASGTVLVLGFAADGSILGRWKVGVLRP